jgi:trehalose/maltose hydrolase-like predicted phosphorylase
MTATSSTAPATLARRFEAIVFDWDTAAASEGRSNRSRVRRLVEEACALGLELAAISRTGVDELDAELAARPSGPGMLWLLVGGGAEAFSVDGHGPRLVYRTTPGREPDAAGWLMGELWRRGVAPGQVLVAGKRLARLAVAVPGAVEAFWDVLGDQVARRARGELPAVGADPAWTLRIDGVDPLLERARESMLTVADGRLGTRGSVLSADPSGDPGVLVSGVYDGEGAGSRLLPAPRWNTIADAARRAVRRVLDLRAGVVYQELVAVDGELEALLFSSLARPGTAVLRVRDPARRLPSAPGLVAPAGDAAEAGTTEGCAWMRVGGAGGSIVAALDDEVRDGSAGRVLDRVAVYRADGVAGERAALRTLRDARELGFDALLGEHRRAWAARWEHADVRIEGDPELQQAVRFALFHLIATVGEGGEAAVGARGLSGDGYRGHVFWDSDAYVLPFAAATYPAGARAMLEYRVRRLPAALHAAAAQGRAGARFPWESAASGEDVTPTVAPGRGGEQVPVLTGGLEEHIVADVAWAAACYLDWSGDRMFARGPGLELFVQTARWWASRIELDADGTGHIRDIMGPDEYHPHVDDNAYTNVMARWNLRRAAAADGVDERERRRWLELAEALVDGYDAATGIYEQFAGFRVLEPLLIAEVAPQRPVAADILLGAKRIRAAQVVKQPDALMLHYLVPAETAPGSLVANLDYYEPRTAHGSSLSPGVHAALLARAGRAGHALELLRLTARIDLDDISQTTAGGLHVAAMGSVWGALAFGFAGLRPTGDALAIDPLLAPGWEALEVRARFRGSRVCIRVTPDRAEVSADPPIALRTPAGERREASTVPATIELRPPGGTPA